jgi:hypothetical protein
MNFLSSGQRTGVSQNGRRGAARRPGYIPRPEVPVDYDADRAPDPAAWLAAEEPARLAAVEAHHRTPPRGHPPTPAPRVHAALHVVVEEQLATGDPPAARRALERLLASGRSRHDAVHAIADVAADSARAALGSGRFDAEAYARALDGLAAG